MRGFMKRVDLFCYKHPRFGVNNLMLYIVFGTLAVWLLGAMDTTGMIESYFAFDAAAVLRGQVWRIITFVFIPQSSGLWLFLFLYFYYFVGSTLEREWGPGRFTIYYLTGMLMTIIYGFITYFVTGRSYFMTSNYINLSMFFAFATLFPDNVVLLFFIIPIKMKWLAVLDALYFVYDELPAPRGHTQLLPLLRRGPLLLRAAPQEDAAPQHGGLQARGAQDKVRDQEQELHAQVCRLRPHGRGLPGPRVPLLLPLRGLSLLLPGPHQQPRPLHGVIIRDRQQY